MGQMAMEPNQRSELGCDLVTDVAHGFGEVRLKVIGASMLPALWPGDVVIVRRRNMAELRSRHVVVYKRQGVLVTHRVTSIRGGLLITRGDSTQHDDPPFDESEIVGQVVCIVRNGRRVSLKESCWLRAVSSVVRHSDFCLRVVLGVGLRWRALSCKN